MKKIEKIFWYLESEVMFFVSDPRQTSRIRSASEHDLVQCEFSCCICVRNVCGIHKWNSHNQKLFLRKNQSRRFYILKLELHTPRSILFLFEVEEIVTTTEVDEESFEEIYRQTKRSIPMLFVRGDAVILVSPPARATWFYHWSHFHFSGNIHDFMFYFTMKINYFSMLLVITLRIGCYVKHEHVWDLVFPKINYNFSESISSTKKPDVQKYLDFIENTLKPDYAEALNDIDRLVIFRFRRHYISYVTLWLLSNNLELKIDFKSSHIKVLKTCWNWGY